MARERPTRSLPAWISLHSPWSTLYSRPTAWVNSLVCAMVAKGFRKSLRRNSCSSMPCSTALKSLYTLSMPSVPTRCSTNSSTIAAFPFTMGLLVGARRRAVHHRAKGRCGGRRKYRDRTHRWRRSRPSLRIPWNVLHGSSRSFQAAVPELRSQGRPRLHVPMKCAVPDKAAQCCDRSALPCPHEHMPTCPRPVPP